MRYINRLFTYLLTYLLTDQYFIKSPKSAQLRIVYLKPGTHWRRSRKDVRHSSDKNHPLSTNSTELNMLNFGDNFDGDMSTINWRQSWMSTTALYYSQLFAIYDRCNCLSLHSIIILLIIYEFILTGVVLIVLSLWQICRCFSWATISRRIRTGLLRFTQFLKRFFMYSGLAITVIV